MDAALSRTFEIFIAVTVVMTALAIGLEISVTVIRDTIRRRLLGAVLVLNLVVIPLAALAIAELLGLEGGERFGFLLCASCAGGPLGLKASQIARGDLPWALSLTVVLMVANVLTLPVWGALLFVDSVGLRPRDVLAGLALVVLLPVLVGMAVRQRDERRAAIAVRRLTTTSNVTLVVGVAVGVVAYRDELGSALASWTPVAALLLLGVSAVTASTLRGADTVRRTTTLVTLNRATSLALLIAGRAFAGEAGVFTAVITYASLQTLTAVGLAVVIGRSASVRARPA